MRWTERCKTTAKLYCWTKDDFMDKYYVFNTCVVKVIKWFSLNPIDQKQLPLHLSIYLFGNLLILGHEDFWNTIIFFSKRIKRIKRKKDHGKRNFSRGWIHRWIIMDICWTISRTVIACTHSYIRKHVEEKGLQMDWHGR